MLQEFFRLNVRFIKDWLTQNKAHLKTGISAKERHRILKPQYIEDNTTTIFGKHFSYSSATAMLHSLDELFISDMYQFKTDTESPLIIDCGANMGLSVIYFKKQYPKSNIIAFEPDARIFNHLRTNIETFFKTNQITLHEKAVWIEDTTLSFYSDGGLSGSTVIDFSHANNQKKVEAVELKKFLTQRVDFLKIDIEGAENTLIFDIEKQLINVENLFLEYHGLKGEDQNLGEILNLLKKSGFQYYIRIAADTMNHPFCKEEVKNFNQQLNIFCYRK